MAALSRSLLASPPSLVTLFPAGASIGQELEVEFVGTFDEWPPQVWASSKDLEIRFLKKKGQARIKVGADAESGPSLIRCFNAEGASEPRFFLLSDRVELIETEPNDSIQDAPVLEDQAMIINGRLSKRGDTDSFQIALEKDQWLVAELHAYRLRSSLDPLLQIIDPHGIKTAFNHDHFHLDPFLSFQAEQPGNYVIQVLGFDYPAKSDIRLGGGQNYVYRLSLDTGPYVSHTYPLSLQQAKPTDVSLIGWNLHSSRTSITPSKTVAESNFEPSVTRHRFQEWQQSITIPTTDFPQAIESAVPKNGPQQLPIPGAISGTIDADDQEDEYTIDLEKDKSYTFSVSTKAPIHQFDAWLELKSSEGKLLKRDDDSRTDRDPAIIWKSNEDAQHTLAIGNLLGNGSPNFYYHLTATAARPNYQAHLEITQLTLKPGSTNDVAITLARHHGHSEALRFRFHNLPVSIQQTGGNVKGDETKASMQLLVSSNAPPYLGEIRFYGTELKTGRRQAVPATFLGTSVNNGVPGGYNNLVLNETPSLWLTILPPPAPADKATESPKP